MKTSSVGRRATWVAAALGSGLALLIFTFVLAGPEAARSNAAPRGGTVFLNTTIATDTVWTAEGSPYVVQGSVWIDAPATLTVEKGVRIELAETAGLIPGINGEGRLVIAGTPEERVVVEDPSPPGPGRRPASLGMKVQGPQDVRYADFRNIFIKGCEPFESQVTCPGDSPLVSFDHVNFLGTIFLFVSGRVRLTNSTITRGIVTRIWYGEVIGNLIWLNQPPTDSNAAGLEVFGGKQTVMSNTIIHNNITGIGAPFGTTAALTLTANNIYGNGRWDLNAQYNTSSLSAPNNWWGTTETEAIRSRITGTVDFLPIATAPIAGAPMPKTVYFPLITKGAVGW